MSNAEQPFSFDVPCYQKKIRIKEDQMVWDHHRSGWKYAISGLQTLHRDNGILFEGYLDGHFWFDRVVNEPFVGFFHNAPEHPEEVSAKYRRIRSLRRLLETDAWQHSSRRCLGLFALSNYLGDFLKEKTGLPVSVVKHPTATVEEVFDFDEFIGNDNKRAFCIGHWMRDFETFFQVRTDDLRKCLLLGGAEKDDHDVVNKYMLKHPDTIKYDYLPDWEYDYMLTENIAFVPMYDASANNVVIECIIRGTPILINRMPAAAEYLGEDYPFFFDDVEDATRKINDMELIEEAARYLREKDKSFLSLEKFVNDFVESEVYRGLKVATPLPML